MPALTKPLKIRIKMERAMRFELTTSTLARLRSTPELHPRPFRVRLYMLCEGANASVALSVWPHAVMLRGNEC